MSEEAHLAATLARLEEKLDANTRETTEGFHRVNTHLATLNGKVAAHEKKFTEHEIANIQSTGALKQLMDAYKVGEEDKRVYKRFFVERLIYLAVTACASYLAVAY